MALENAIYNKAAECLKVFNGCIESVTSTPWPQDQLDRFNLWAAHGGIFGSYQQHTSMDWRLRERPELVEMILQLLVLLREYLSASCILTGPVAGRVIAAVEDTSCQIQSPSSHTSASTSSSECSFGLVPETPSVVADPIDTMRGKVEQTLSELFRISAAIRSAGMSYRHTKAANFIEWQDGVNLTQRFKEGVELLLRYKKPSPSEYMVKRLIETVCLRQRELAYSRRKRVGRGEKEESAKSHNVASLPPRSTAGYSRQGGSGSTTSKIARTAVGAFRGKIAQHDTVQSTVYTATYVPTIVFPQTKAVKTLMTRPQWSTIDDSVTNLPPPPEVGERLEFECPYCGIPLERAIFQGSSWRNHVLEDLRPYVCILPDCKTPHALYKNSDSWISHMQTQHKVAKWKCVSSCQSIIRNFQTEAEFLTHAENEHKEEFTIEEMLELANIGRYEINRELGVDILLECPICTISFEDKDFLAVYSHIAEDLTRNAWISLPESPYADANVSQKASSKSTSVDDGEIGQRRESEAEADRMFPWSLWDSDNPETRSDLASHDADLKPVPDLSDADVTVLAEIRSDIRNARRERLQQEPDPSQKFLREYKDVTAGDARSQTSAPVNTYTAGSTAFVKQAAFPNPYFNLTKLDKKDIRICVAEDNPINQKLIIIFLQRLGYISIGAYENGLQAVEDLRQKAKEGIPYHIIFMDDYMPVLNGYDATKLIRNDLVDEVRKILVIAMTASDRQSDLEKCLAVGMNDYLRKPINAEPLRRTLDAYIAFSPHNEVEIGTYFNGEILQGKMLDMLISTFEEESARNIRELCLYASGKRVVINHWLSSEGVSCLSNLEALNIYVIKDSMTEERCKRAFEYISIKFGDLSKKINEKRHLEGRKELFVNVEVKEWEPEYEEKLLELEDISERSFPNLSKFTKRYCHLVQNSVDKEPWGYQPTRVAIIDNEMLATNSDHFRELATNQQQLDDQQPKGRHERSSRQPNEGPLWSRIKEGRSFLDDGHHAAQWFLASDSHGTQIAKIISSIDPCCDLYVARVSSGRSGITPARVAMAIRWAISKDVDVIFMSFAFRGKTDELEILEIACLEAAKCGIAMLCSAHNEGTSLKHAYPADFDDTITIATCNKFGIVPIRSRNQSYEFAINDEEVSIGILSLKNWNKYVLRSSLATAIAAGLSSLILSCDRLARWEEENYEQREKVTIVKHHLQKMTVNESKFVQPEKFAGIDLYINDGRDIDIETILRQVFLRDLD